MGSRSWSPTAFPSERVSEQEEGAPPSAACSSDPDGNSAKSVEQKGAQEKEEPPSWERAGHRRPLTDRERRLEIERLRNLRRQRLVGSPLSFRQQRLSA